MVAFVTCHLSHCICHIAFVTLHLSGCICQVAFVILHLSSCICHVAFATYHLSSCIYCVQKCWSVIAETRLRSKLFSLGKKKNGFKKTMGSRKILVQRQILGHKKGQTNFKFKEIRINLIFGFPLHRG